MRLRSLMVFAITTLAVSSQATILTFDIDGASNGSVMPDGYGDNVTAATMGGYHYDVSNGTTPDIVTSYLGKASQTNVNFWADNYSDLTNVCEYEPENSPGYSVTLTAAPGWNVRLNGFDLGNYGSTVTVPSITIYDQGGAILEQYNDYVLPADPHQTFAYAPALEAQAITIDFDVTGLGGNSDNVGIDNISFNQVPAAPVPEPASLAALAIGGAALLRRRKASK